MPIKEACLVGLKEEIESNFSNEEKLLLSKADQILHKENEVLYMWRSIAEWTLDSVVGAVESNIATLVGSKLIVFHDGKVKRYGDFEPFWLIPYIKSRICIAEVTKKEGNVYVFRKRD